VVRARGGDRDAVEALLQRCLPGLRRWAHGRLPPAARASLDTQDLVQETVLHVLRRLDHFEPRHVGAMQAYLRQSVINRIRDEVRKVSRHPSSVELPADLMSDRTSPLEWRCSRRRISTTARRSAAELARSRAGGGAHRGAVVGGEIAKRFEMPTPDAARMAVGRALKRLTTKLHGKKES
jgi:RNA polymerase sigma-70 factor (ECF subfamily)